jgi:hypothetical protein
LLSNTDCIPSEAEFWGRLVELTSPSRISINFFEVRIMIANVPGVFAQDAHGECDASSDLNHLSDGY